jgi:hypothetical protein
MGELMTYLTGFSLAAGAGAKAFIPVLALGGLHYTPYFELADRFAWVASPPVMAVLGVLVIVELVVDASPERGEYSDTVAYLPKLAAGVIAFAAATGTLDESLLELGASGLLGAGTAAGTHWIRTRLRRPMREYVENVHEGFGKTATAGEAGVAVAAVGTGIFVPVLGVVLLALLGIAALTMAVIIDRRRVACIHADCGQPIRPGALVCKHCGREQTDILLTKEALGS